MILRLSRLAGLLLLLLAAPAAAQPDPLARAAALEAEAQRLFEAKRADEALARAGEALTLREAVRGPQDPAVLPSLEQLAVFRFMLAQYPASEALLRRALAIREATLGPEHAEVASTLNLLGRVYQTQARYAEAAALFERSLALQERLAGPDGVMLQATNLGLVYQAQGRHAEAEPLLARAVGIAERRLGPDAVEVAVALGNLGVLQQAAGRYDAAEAVWRRALAIHEKAGGRDSMALAVTLNNLAGIALIHARLAEAEALFGRALSMQERLFGPDHPEVARSLLNLGEVYAAQARFTEAEAVARRSLTIREATLGAQHPDVAYSLNNLAMVYVEERRFAEAEALYRRAAEVLAAAVGPGHASVATAINNLALTTDRQGRVAEAEALYRRSVALREAALGPDHPDVAAGLSNLAGVLDRLGRAAEALPLLTRSLAIRERVFGPDHPDVALALNNLAELLQSLDRPAEAEPLYRRAVAIYERALGPDHPDVGAVLDNLAILYFRQRRHAEGLGASRRAVAILGRWLDRSTGREGMGDAQRRTRRDWFLRNVNLLHLAEGAAGADEAFRVAQRASASGAAQAVAGMAARFAAGSDALAAAVRERQDLARQAGRLETALLAAVSRPPERRDGAAETVLRAQATEIAARLAALDARIARDFPRYAELAQPQPLGLAEAQALLAPDEAMVVWLAGVGQSWLWVLRRDRAGFHRLAITGAALAEEVRALRRRLDPDHNPIDVLRPFEATRAHALHQALLAPAVPLLAGARQIFVVPDGALESLPIGVLVTRAPAADPVSPADHRDVAWLARDHAVAVLPSVGALRALRQFTAAARAGAPFLGVGAPALEGRPGSTRGGSATPLFRGAGADVAAVRRLAALPETADELRAVARSLGAGEADLLLGPRAREAALRGAGLERFRVIAFATHGLTSGELSGLAEPALVLTPPDRASAEEDGLLTASEVATLSLDADWVVLSACNTAAPDGGADAGGLSGLAKAFFHAGARALLVSHWSVPSNATVALVTGTFEAARAAPAIGRAEALRRAMLRLIDDRSLPPEFAHPLAWAPFVLAGEGSAGH